VKRSNEKFSLIELEPSDMPVTSDITTWMGDYPSFDAIKTINAIASLSKRPDLLIVDHYAVDYTWERMVRKYVNKMLVIDDFTTRPHDCDILLNQNVLPDSNVYDDNSLVDRSVIKMLGSDYIILNKEIIDIEPAPIATEIKRINISLGGSDVGNDAQKILEIIIALKIDVNIDVILGHTSSNVKLIRKFIADYDNINLYVGISNMGVLRLLNRADICIGGSGMTGYERCMLRRPSLYFCIASHQREMYKNISRYNSAGAMGNLKDDYEKTLSETIKHYYDHPDKLYDLTKYQDKVVNRENINKLVDTIISSIQ
jgi:UDP-2,4-diacetamido-2,4,6-trideoxy-beta-L-altropyranose hydrolase